MVQDKFVKKLEQKGYKVRTFRQKEKTAQYLQEQFHNDTIGFGDSQTLLHMGLYALLSKNNIVYDPNQFDDNDNFLKTAKKALTAKYFLTSVNAITEDGIIINMDGTGNRVAGSLFGHEKVFFIFGTNKIVSNIEEGVWRTRNIAAPQNAKRIGCNTPCALKGDRCYDCNSPYRICSGLLIQYKKMNDSDAEIIIIDEDLGF